MRLLLLALVALLTGCMAPAFVPAGHAAQAEDLSLKAVALVAKTGTGFRVYCSGVWVSERRILTAAHCVDELEIGDSVDYITTDNEPSHSAFLAATDPLHDLALIRTAFAPPHRSALLAFDNPRPGDFVQTLGAPLGLTWSYSSGDVAAIRQGAWGGEWPMWWVQTTAPISPGNSGGGLFNSYGELVGICHGNFTRGQNLNLFVHPMYIEPFLKSNP